MAYKYINILNEYMYMYIDAFLWLPETKSNKFIFNK